MSLSTGRVSIASGPASVVLIPRGWNLVPLEVHPLSL
jgi:hypothetical protein